MLSQDQIRFFHDNGYLILRGFLPTQLVAELRAAADGLQADAIAKLAQPGYANGLSRLNKDWIEHPQDHYVYREKPDGTLSFHRVERMFTRQSIFRSFAMQPRILEAIWQIIGRPFWPRAGALVVKLPHEGAEVRWHQDIPYLYWSSGGHPGRGRPTTHPIPNFTTDIYLEDSNPNNGCLYAIPGSHRNGTVDVDKLVARHGFMLPDAVALELRPGNLMFHHTALVHGSPENRSAATRRTYYVHYMNDETVADAYSDWPDLLMAEQNTALWTAAMASCGGNGFVASAGGIKPAHPNPSRE